MRVIIRQYLVRITSGTYACATSRLRWVRLDMFNQDELGWIKSWTNVSFTSVISMTSLISQVSPWVITSSMVWHTNKSLHGHIRQFNCCPLSRPSRIATITRMITCHFNFASNNILFFFFVFFISRTTKGQKYIYLWGLCLVVLPKT